MTDLHSHILPAMDDGAKDVDQSVAMLRTLASQGVSTVAATPHFKPRHNQSVAEFLAKRQASYDQLKSAIVDIDRLPDIRLGAEVTLSVELSHTEGLNQLCYQGTNFLLVELDYSYIGPWALNSLYELGARCGVTPVIAHIDRYFGNISTKLIEEIIELNCPIQFNASALNDFWCRRKLIKLMHQYPESFFVVGSDCHDMERRCPDMESFKTKAIKHLGVDGFEEICENSQLLINNKLIV